MELWHALRIDLMGWQDRKGNLDADVGLGPMEVLWHALRIDLMGWQDRKGNLDVDVGLGPMEVLWHAPGTQLLKRSMEAKLVPVFNELGKKYRT
eukprot:1338189-Pyramimonas_sp.AAC.1